MAVEAQEKQSAVIQKWDAQGNLTGEIDLENFAVDGVLVIQDRLIVCGETANLRKLMVLDASGKVLSEQPLLEEQAVSASLIVLDEERVLTVGTVYGDTTDASDGNLDVQIDILRIAP